MSIETFYVHVDFFKKFYIVSFEEEAIKSWHQIKELKPNFYAHVKPVYRKLNSWLTHLPKYDVYLWLTDNVTVLVNLHSYTCACVHKWVHIYLSKYHQNLLNLEILFLFSDSHYKITKLLIHSKQMLNDTRFLLQ